MTLVDVVHAQCASVEGEFVERHLHRLLRGRGVPEDYGHATVRCRCHALDVGVRGGQLASVSRHHAVEFEGVEQSLACATVAVDDTQLVADEEAGVDVLCPVDVGKVGAFQHSRQGVEEGHGGFGMLHGAVLLVVGWGVGRIFRQQHLGLAAAQAVEGITHGVQLPHVVGPVGMAGKEVEGQVLGQGTLHQWLMPRVEGAGGATHLDVGIALADGRGSGLVDVEVVVEGAGEESVLQVGLVPNFDIAVGVFAALPHLGKALIDGSPCLHVVRAVHESAPLRGTVLQDSRCVAVGYDEYGGVLLRHVQQVDNVGEGVQEVAGRAPHTWLAVQVVLAASHLVAHRARLQFF